MRGLSKSFGTLRALQEVDFTLRAGEIHALLGENGAGKSTLIKAVTGVFPRDAGIVRLGGAEVAPRSAKAAVDAGIATVYQEVNLLLNLSVAQKLYRGRQPTRFGLVREAEMRRCATELLPSSTCISMLPSRSEIIRSRSSTSPRSRALSTSRRGC